MPPEDDSADFVVSICFRSEQTTAEEMVRVIGIQPTSIRPKNVPWSEGGGDAGGNDNLHRIYYQSAKRLPGRHFAIDDFEAHLRERLALFAARPESLAEIRRVCDRITIACSIRSSGPSIMLPFSPDTLLLLAAVGFEFHLTCRTKTPQKTPDEVPNPYEDCQRVSWRNCQVFTWGGFWLDGGMGSSERFRFEGALSSSAA